MSASLLALCCLTGPLTAAPLDILTDTRLGDQRRTALEQATGDAVRWLNRQTGRDIAGRYVVLGTDRRGIDAVLEAGYARLEKPLPRVPDITDRICAGKRPNAIATPDFVLVCWPLAPAPDRAKHLGALLVHELFHQMQYDLTRTRTARPGTGPRRLGPAWMVEGTAEVMEMLYVLGRVPEEGEALFNLQNPARRARLTLTDLKEHGTVRDFYGYGVARFAASLLAREHGIEALLAYFRWLGRGVSQEAAFEQSFGLTFEEFDAAFEGVRRDYGAARDWGRE